MRNQNTSRLVEEEISITTDSSGGMNDQRSESVGSSDRKIYLIDLFECEVIVRQLLLMARHRISLKSSNPGHIM